MQTYDVLSDGIIFNMNFDRQQIIVKNQDTILMDKKKENNINHILKEVNIKLYQFVLSDSQKNININGHFHG
jgi:hypothetical protein